MTRRLARALAVLAVAGFGLGLAGCGNGASTSAASSSPSASSSTSSGDASSSGADPYETASSGGVLAGSGDLPPRTLRGLQRIYGPAVEAMGLRLTRGAVLRLKTGPHLQLYVEPTGTAISPQDFLDRVLPLIRATGPPAFAEYADLATFDICQEPAPGVDDSPEPKPVTVVFLTRAQVEQVDWATATLKDLRRIVRDVPGGQLEVDDQLAALPAWTAAAP